MVPKTLTVVERQSLANQFRILAKFNDDDSYLINAEILEKGYTGRYHDVFSVNPDETSLEICNETDTILNMYRFIENAIAKLTPEEKADLDLKKIEFEGFDANNDLHYGYMTFMVQKLDLWKEYQGRYLNSHSQLSLMKYRNMLKYYNELMKKNKYDFDIKDIEHFIEIA